MGFRFNVNLSEQDYLDFNVFWMTRSQYGKKQISNFRIMIAVIIGIFIFISLFGGGFTADSFIGIIPLLIVLLLFQLFWPKILAWSLKHHINDLKKSGKMGYSPSSVIEFYEDSFTETTTDNKTEQKYSAIERISVVDSNVIYIHINNLMAYIVPMACFESKEQYEMFLDFIKTKCNVIDFY